MSRIVRLALVALALGAIAFTGVQVAAADSGSGSLASCLYNPGGCHK